MNSKKKHPLDLDLLRNRVLLKNGGSAIIPPSKKHRGLTPEEIDDLKFMHATSEIELINGIKKLKIGAGRGISDFPCINGIFILWNEKYLNAITCPVYPFCSTEKCDCMLDQVLDRMKETLDTMETRFESNDTQKSYIKEYLNRGPLPIENNHETSKYFRDFPSRPRLYFSFLSIMNEMERVDKKSNSSIVNFISLYRLQKSYSATGISNDTVRDGLKLLIKTGMIKKINGGRIAKYSMRKDVFPCMYNTFMMGWGEDMLLPVHCSCHQGCNDETCNISDVLKGAKELITSNAIQRFLE